MADHGKRLKAAARRKKTGLQQSASPARLEPERLVDPKSLRGSVLKRVAPAVRELVNVSRDESLLEALTTNTAMDALIHLVSGGAAAQVACNVQDPLREAKARAAKKTAELLTAEGGPLGVEDVAKLLRITRAAVDKRRKGGTLVGVDDGGRAILYPSWQFTATGLLPGLDAVLKAMGVSDPWMRMQFFLGHDVELEGRPLDLLRNGRLDEVIGAAERFGAFGDDG